MCHQWTNLLERVGVSLNLHPPEYSQCAVSLWQPGGEERKVFLWVREKVTYTVQDTSNLLFSVELTYRQSTDSHTAKCSNPGSVCRHFMKSPRTPHEESADTSQRVRGHFTKSLRNRRVGSADQVSRRLMPFSSEGNETGARRSVCYK